MTRCNWRRVEITTVEHRDIRPVAWAQEQLRFVDTQGVLFFSYFYGHTIEETKIDDAEGFTVKIALGADHAGFRLKDEIKSVLEEQGHEVEDFGCHCSDSIDYPDYALPVAEKVAAGEADRGILICGTGIGMSIAANKVPGVRCALVHDLFSAKATREHNDSNVLAMGERVIGPGLALEIVKVWVNTEFSQGPRHQNRIDKIKGVEDKFALHP